MQWFVLFAIVLGSSALTIRQGDDNIAMESYENKGGRKGRTNAGLNPNRQRQPQPLQNTDSNTANSESTAEQAFFTNLHGDGLGFSSFVQHHSDDSQIIQEGSNMEIKKVAPKSSVTFKMFSDAGPEPKANEEIVEKQKFKPPKHFHESLPGYKKGNAVSPFKVPIRPTPLSIKETTEFTPSALFSQFKPPQTTQSALRKPYTFSTVAPSYKVKEAPSSHHHHPHPHHHHHHDLGAIPSHLVESNAITIDGHNSKWKALGSGVEISANYDEYLSKQRKVRKPKHQDLQRPIVQSPSHFDHQHEERYKSERFDHQKALQGSTSFNIGNAIDVGILSTHHQHQHHHHHHQGPATNKEPIKHYNPPKGIFDLPVLTEDEFQKQFGKHPKELLVNTPTLPKKPIKRIPFDQRVQGKRNLRHNTNYEQLAQSFIHFNGDWLDEPLLQTAQKDQRSVKGTSQVENVDLSPSNFYPGHIFSSAVEMTGPQQFSVGASYQIEKGHF